jgi:hypothetical protein
MEENMFGEMIKIITRKMSKVTIKNTVEVVTIDIITTTMKIIVN